MKGTALLISILLLSAGSAAAACTLYADQEDSRRAVNRLMYAMGISLLLWNFGLALRVSAAGRAAAVIGSYIAPVGYGSLFGFLLHYVLVITGCGRVLRRWWVYPLIYLPGAVTIFGLTVLPACGFYPYRLERTWMGWVNATENIWLWIFYLYYTVFLGIIVYVLVRWLRRSNEGFYRRQAFALTDSILAMAVLGSLTDALPGFFGVQLPGVASAFAILPVYSVCYSVKKLQFMKPVVLNPDEQILKNAEHVRYLYRAMGACFLLGGILPFFGRGRIASYAIPGGPYLLGAVMLISGLLIFLVSRLSPDERFRELIAAFLFSCFIPFLTLVFSSPENMVMWTFLFLIWIPGVLFNRGILLRTVLLATFQAQLVAIGSTGFAALRVGADSYLMQIGILLLASGLCFFVNSLYRRRLRENARHAGHQAIVTEISHKLLLTSEENWDTVIPQILGTCGNFMGCRQAYLVVRPQGAPARICAWRDGSLESVRGVLDANAHAFFSAVWQLTGEQPDITVWYEAPRQSARPDLDICCRQMHIRSLVTMPVCPDGGMGGFLCFGSPDATHNWGEQDTFVRIIADMIADTFVKMRSNRRIRDAAYHDRLTGLPNRLLLRKKLDRALRLAGDSGRTMAVVFFDVDAFKSVNDSMGHEQGDRLLQQVARRLTEQAEGGDIVARVGGDEFVMMQPVSDGESLRRRMERIMWAIRQPVMLAGQEFFITGSAGVALYPQDGRTAEELIANADIAMYQAKNSGRNQYTFCSQDMRDRLAGRMRLTALLYHAQEKNQLEIYYQPQVSLVSRRIVGVEALLRWKLPERGMVGPAEFIPLAEQTGLIQPIGAWVLETACRQCRQWIDRGLPPVRMAVNVSLQQLRHTDFAEQVMHILRRTGMPPGQLELEVTESVANSGSVDVPACLSKLKKLGVTISIDDFGTGYSSLNRLKLLPVDRLKLDIQFVRGIERNEKDRAITKVIISLAKSLHMHVIAEGVETAAQLAFLNERLCDEVQGFYYYRPMPEPELARVLAEGFADSGVHLA